MTDDRKQRLKALAARAGRTKKPVADENDGTTEDKSQVAQPNISFRNYAPTDKSLSSRQEKTGVDDGDPSRPSASKRQRMQEDDTAQLAKAAPVSSSKALQNALAEAKRGPAVASSVAPASRATNSNETITISTMAPKKINWDLKRDISEKLAKLERRTQKSIVRILKERLEMEAENAADEDGSDREGSSDLD